MKPFWVFDLSGLPSTLPLDQIVPKPLANKGFSALDLARVGCESVRKMVSLGLKIEGSFWCENGTAEVVNAVRESWGQRHVAIGG